MRRTYARARRRPGTQPARASAAPTNPRREPIAVSTHAGTPAGKVPSKCTYIDRRTRGARRRRTSSGPQRCAAATTRTCVTACDAEYLVCTYIDGSARPPSPSPGGSPRFAPCRTKPFHFISTDIQLANTPFHHAQRAALPHAACESLPRPPTRLSTCMVAPNMSTNSILTRMLRTP